MNKFLNTIFLVAMILFGLAFVLEFSGYSNPTLELILLAGGLIVGVAYRILFFLDLGKKQDNSGKNPK